MTYIGELFSEQAIKDDPIELQIRDNLPTVAEGKYGSRRRAVCEFCQEKHDVMTEHCELEIMGLDCSKPDIASKVLLQNVLDQMYWKRNLAFAVVIKKGTTTKWNYLRHQEADDDSDGEDVMTGKGVTLGSCFSGY